MTTTGPHPFDPEADIRPRLISTPCKGCGLPRSAAVHQVVTAATPAVTNARNVMIKYFGWRFNHTQGRATELTVKMLRAALGREEIARELFIIDSEQSNFEFTGKIWDNTGDTSPVKRQYLMMADRLIAFIIGDLVPTLKSQPGPPIHFDPPRSTPFYQPPPSPETQAVVQRLIERDRNRRHDPA
jgi:hypothetical protein